MPQKIYLDENGNPKPAAVKAKVYLDDEGNPKTAAVAAPYKPTPVPMSAAQRGRAPIDYTPEEFNAAAGRELILGGAERAGIDLEHPFTGTIKNWAHGIAGIGQVASDVMTGQGYKHGEDLLNTVKGLAAPYVETGQGVYERDPQKMAHGTGGILTDLMTAGMSTAKGAQAADTAITKVGSAPVKAVKAVGDAAATAITGAPMKPIDALFRAIKPRAGKTGFNDALNVAAPEIKAAEAALSKPIETIEDFIAGSKLAKKKLRGQFEQIAGPQAKRGIDLTPMADAMDSAPSLKSNVQTPQVKKALQAESDRYRNRTFTIEEAEELLHDTNAELEAYYDKNPGARRTAGLKNPDTAVLVAQGKKLRELLYKHLDDGSTNQAAREINRRYGALMEVEEEAHRRLNVVRRQQPESLTEQMGRLGAGFKAAKGAYRMTAGFDPVGGFGDIVSAYGGRKLARIIKEQNSADYMIKNAFKRFQGTPAPITMPGPFKPAGLLRSGGRMMPAPETSGVRGTPSPIQPGNRAIRTGRLLEAGKPLPVTDSSAVRAQRAPTAAANRAIRTGRILESGKPLAPGSEPPSGGFKMTVTTGKPPTDKLSPSVETKRLRKARKKPAK